MKHEISINCTYRILPILRRGIQRIVFDNMKPVVTTYGYKNNKVLSEEIVKFATYYDFKINTTNGRKGNEKATSKTAKTNPKNFLV